MHSVQNSVRPSKKTNVNSPQILYEIDTEGIFLILYTNYHPDAKTTQRSNNNKIICFYKIFLSNIPSEHRCKYFY